MARIDEMYKQGTIEQKRKIISSIYPEKMSFDGNTSRTNRLNSIVGLIFNLDKDFSRIKNRTNEKKFHLSGWEVPSGFEPLYELLQSSA